MNRAIAAAIMAASAAVTSPGIAKDQMAHLYGPPPSWSRFVALAEPALQSQLIDPESARLTWAGGFFKGAFKPFLSARVEGYVGCGHVNARNRMGGYAGATAFVVVIDYDRVLYASIADPHFDAISLQCKKALEEGLIPPLPSSDLSQTSTAVLADTNVTTASGMTLRPMPEGAYVVAVAPGSAAATAGLTPGMVITSVNGIPLAGMGEAMTKVVGAATAGATLVLVGGTTIKLGVAK